MLSKNSNQTITLCLIGIGVICLLSTCQAFSVDMTYQNLTLHLNPRHIWDYDSYLMFQNYDEDELYVYNFTNGSSYRYTSPFYSATRCQLNRIMYVQQTEKTYCEQYSDDFTLSLAELDMTQTPPVVTSVFKGDKYQGIDSVINETLVLESSSGNSGQIYCLFNTSTNEVYKNFSLYMGQEKYAALERWTTHGLVFIQYEYGVFSNQLPLMIWNATSESYRQLSTANNPDFLHSLYILGNEDKIFVWSDSLIQIWNIDGTGMNIYSSGSPKRQLNSSHFMSYYGSSISIFHIDAEKNYAVNDGTFSFKTSSYSRSPANYLPKRGLIVYSTANQVAVINSHTFEVVSLSNAILGSDGYGNIYDTYPVLLGNGSYMKFDNLGYKIYDQNFKFVSWIEHYFNFFYQTPSSPNRFYAMNIEQKDSEVDCTLMTVDIPNSKVSEISYNDCPDRCFIGHIESIQNEDEVIFSCQYQVYFLNQTNYTQIFETSVWTDIRFRGSLNEDGSVGAFFSLESWKNYKGLVNLQYYDMTASPPAKLNSTTITLYGDISKISDKYYLTSSATLQGTKIGVYDIWAGNYVYQTTLSSLNITTVVPLGYDELNPNIIDAFAYQDINNNVYVYDVKVKESKVVEIENFQVIYISSAGTNQFAVYTYNSLVGKMWMFKYENKNVGKIEIEKFLQ